MHYVVKGATGFIHKRLITKSLARKGEKVYFLIRKRSSMGVLSNTPRFSACIAGKAVLEAWVRCVCSEFVEVGISFTNIGRSVCHTTDDARYSFMG